MLFLHTQIALLPKTCDKKSRVAVTHSTVTVLVCLLTPLVSLYIYVSCEKRTKRNENKKRMHSFFILFLTK